ncbi:MAG: tetratricopeptide repeat protein [Magnetococcales bacterium]|nr:tetratricopeptide repeat protein [Magnetococcales bacterium]
MRPVKHTYLLSGWAIMVVGLLAILAPSALSLFGYVSDYPIIDKIVLSGIVTALLGGWIARRSSERLRPHHPENKEASSADQEQTLINVAFRWNGESTCDEETFSNLMKKISSRSVQNLANKLFSRPGRRVKIYQIRPDLALHYQELLEGTGIFFEELNADDEQETTNEAGLPPPASTFRLSIPQQAIPVFATLLALSATLWPLLDRSPDPGELAVQQRLYEKQQQRAAMLEKKISKNNPVIELESPNRDKDRTRAKLSLLEFNDQETISLHKASLSALRSEEINKAERLLDKTSKILVNKAENQPHQKNENLLKAASIQAGLANIKLERAELDGAINHLTEALDMTPDQQIDKRIDLLTKLATTQQKRGLINEAERTFLRAAVIGQQSYGTNNQKVAPILKNWGQFYTDIGRLAPAKQKFQEALSIEKKALGETHPDVEKIEQQISIIQKNQQIIAENAAAQASGTPVSGNSQTPWTGQSTDAGQNSGTTTSNNPPPTQESSSAAAPPPSTPIAVTPLFQAPTFDNKTVTLANNAIQNGNYVLAENLLSRLLEVKKVTTGAESLAVASSLHNLASALANQGKFSQAEKLINESIQIKRNYLSDSDPTLINGYRNLAAIYRAQKKYAQAIQYQNQALAIQKNQLGASNPAVAISYNDLARLYQRNNDLGQAKYYYEQSLAILQSTPSPNNPYVAVVLANYAATLKQLNNPIAANYYEDRLRAVQSGVQ